MQASANRQPPSEQNRATPRLPASVTTTQAANESPRTARIDNCRQALQGSTAIGVLQWTLNQSDRVVLSTSFGPDSAVLLKLASDIRPDIPIVWVDTGYNTAATYRFADRLINEWSLNVHIFQPARTAAHISAVLGELPALNEQQHGHFTNEVKLEPFRRALAELRPDYWLTGVRRSETAFRQTLQVAEPGPGDIIKIAPLLHWTDDDVAHCMDTHSLPSENDYHDVTKVMAKRECGLHCRL